MQQLHDSVFPMHWIVELSSPSVTFNPNGLSLTTFQHCNLLRYFCNLLIPRIILYIVKCPSCPIARRAQVRAYKSDRVYLEECKAQGISFSWISRSWSVGRMQQVEPCTCIRIVLTMTQLNQISIHLQHLISCIGQTIELEVALPHSNDKSIHAANIRCLAIIIIIIASVLLAACI